MIDIVDKRDCTGCWGCANICPKSCITMKTDKEGFDYPIVDESTCVKCKKCINVCPILHKEEIENNPVAYACFNKDEEVRTESSSGGIFTLIATNIIKDNGVVFGARFNELFEVEHSYVESVEDIKVFRGSKYVQSKMGYTFTKVKKFLEDGRKVLFSGTPCQIGGLKSFLGKDYKNLICIDIICHGVPSPKVWKDYLEWAEQKYKSKCIGVDFRNKKKFGWAAHKETLQLKDYRGKVKCFHSEVFKNMFYSHYTIRPSCYKCPYKDIMHPADITIADFWKIDSAIPGFNDDKGVSLVLINNEKGEKVFDLIKKDLIYQTSTVEKCMMSTMQRPFSKPEDREEFWDSYLKKDFDFMAKKYGEYGLINAFKRSFKLGIGRVYRRIRKY